MKQENGLSPSISLRVDSAIAIKGLRNITRKFPRAEIETRTPSAGDQRLFNSSDVGRDLSLVQRAPTFFFSPRRQDHPQAERQLLNERSRSNQSKRPRKSQRTE